MIVTLTDLGFTDKPSRTDYWKLTFSDFDLTIEDIYKSLTKGHTMSCTFAGEYNYSFFMRKGFSKRENFKHIHYVMFDIDGTVDDTLDELIDNLRYKPNIAYTTFSHQIDENHGNRYRLLYFFVQPILNPHLYRELYDKIGKDIPCAKDNSAKSPYQMCHGTTRLNPWYQDYLNEDIYNITDFKCRCKNIPRGDNSEITDIELYENTSEFFSDLPMLTDSELLEKYSGIYEVVNHSDTIDVGDERYELYGDEYKYVNENWVWCKNSYGIKYQRPRIWHDGEGRRNKLFRIAMITKAIKPDISKEEMLYSLIYYKMTRFDNSDGVLNNRCLYKIMENAYKNIPTPDTGKGKHPVHKVNMKYCAEHNRTRQSVLGEVLRDENFKKIDKWYDDTKTIEWNIENLKSIGARASKGTIDKWKKQRVPSLTTQSYIISPISYNNSKNWAIEGGRGTNAKASRNQHGESEPEEEIVALIDFTKSIRWNLNNLKETGHHIGYNRLSELYKKHKP